MEELFLGQKEEWTIFPMRVCRVTGTVYHETCIIGGNGAEYPCCDLKQRVEYVD